MHAVCCSSVRRKDMQSIFSVGASHSSKSSLRPPPNFLTLASSLDGKKGLKINSGARKTRHSSELGGRHCMRASRSKVMPDDDVSPAQELISKKEIEATPLWGFLEWARSRLHAYTLDQALKKWVEAPVVMTEFNSSQGETQLHSTQLRQSIDYQSWWKFAEELFPFLDGKKCTTQREEEK